MSEPLLEEDHDSIGDIFRELNSCLEGGDAERAFNRLDTLWARLAVHIRAEHLCLFPAVLDACDRAAGPDAPAPAEVRDAVSRLREDHNFFMRELAALVETMRVTRARGAGDPKTSVELEGVRRRLSSVESRLAAHNELEEEKVYRWTSQLLDGEESELLRARLRRELENLPPRLEAEA